MNSRPSEKQETTTQQDVSRRALSIARMIDRLEPGKFTITLTKPPVGTWSYEVIQPVTIQKNNLP